MILLEIAKGFKLTHYSVTSDYFSCFLVFDATMCYKTEDCVQIEHDPKLQSLTPRGFLHFPGK